SGATVGWTATHSRGGRSHGFPITARFSDEWGRAGSRVLGVDGCGRRGTTGCAGEREWFGRAEHRARGAWRSWITAARLAHPGAGAGLPRRAGNRAAEGFRRDQRGTAEPRRRRDGRAGAGG